MPTWWRSALVTGLICMGPPLAAQTSEQVAERRRIEAERLRNDWAGLGRYRQANAELARTPQENRVVFMGNSITEGWAPRFATHFPGKPYIGRGIGGQTTPQMLVRFRQDVVALQPNVVVILAGTNDIAGNTGPATLEMIQDNLESMVEIAKANGIRVVLSSVLPAYDYPWKRGLTPAGKIVTLNAWMKDYAAKNDVTYLDYHSAMADERQGLKRQLSSDGVHPNEAGYRVMAPLAEQAIARALSARSTHVPPPQGGRDGDAMPAEWTQVHPDGETTCAFDTPFSFFHHVGSSPSKLLIYFEGGGACWEWVSCSGMFDTSVSDDEISEFRGIFDFTNPANPFRDFTVVFVPYCTGDVHIGDAIQQYGDSATARPVAHRGYRNVSAVLRWVSSNVPAPTHVVVSGTSAGSYGALFYAPRIARLYPSATLSLIGDSGVPLLNDYRTVLERWGTASVIRRLRDIAGPLRPEDLTLERAHAYLADAHPHLFLTQITTDSDAIQSAFYLISGSPGARDATYALLDSLESTIPAFRTYVVSGGDHGLLVTDKFYSYEVGGVRLSDWIGRVASGERVESRRCATCRVR